MSKSVSIPISLNELKRASFRRLSSRKEKKKETPIGGFIILVQETANTVKLYGSTAGEIGDEIVSVNEMQVEGKTHGEVVQYIQECIRKKLIQLNVRRRPVNHSQNEGSSVITDAYLVSVDKERTKDLTSRLKKEYPDIRVFDMETVAAGKKTTFEVPAKIPQTLNENEDGQRLKHYEVEVKEQLNLKLERQKENEFLRSSLRSSKKLKALSYTKDSSNILKNVQEPKSYENHCYEQKETEDNNNLSIPLNQVIVSVDRLSDHLSQMGSEEECRILREYFKSQEVVDAIQATAVKRSDTSVANRVSCVNSQPNGTKADEPVVKLVTLHKEEDSYLGATVRNEDNRIIVGRVVKGGIVEKTGVFKQGDELLEMNGVPLRGKTISEVCELLRNTSGDIKFAVSSTTQDEKQGSPNEIHHLRALFDYDPEDDIYLPCKELALKFERGDILHILNTSDENWWQAYRDGDDVAHQLAGLVPSTSFHEQVVLCTEELLQDAQPKPRKQRKSIPEVIRTFGRKSGAEIQRSMDEPQHTAINFQQDILSYEDVVLHLSRSDHRRPLVLCGPEGVGCLQLRQKLLESDNQRLASPVPYTTRPMKDGEENGVHYHFVSKQQFMDDAKSGFFVEFGEYHKHLYGTAVADIVRVIKNGKTCVMTLKAESLQSVRTGEVMPYIVFIAPPPLIQLRRQKEYEGQFDVKDQELKNILTQGKHIEQKYGHLFDDIIVNTEFDRSFSELKKILKNLDTQPHWVPARWLDTVENKPS